MAVRQTALLTAEDYRALPDDGPRYQLVQGELFMAPAPNRYHQDILRNITFLLLQYLQTHPIGKLYFAPFDVYLTEHNVFQPDLLFVANNRLSTLQRDGAHGAPTLVIEILSDSSARLDGLAKKDIYMTTGVLEMWLIDPEEKSVAVFRLQENAEQPIAIWKETDQFESACFPGLMIDASAIFKD
jgi:Uma2 family endonuclease